MPKPEINDIDLEEIARLITEGNTGGRLDSEDKKIFWDLKLEVWSDNDDALICAHEGCRELQIEDCEFCAIHAEDGQ